MSFSREVGRTCPQDCFFLGNGCYSQRLGNLRPNIKASYKRNELLNINQAIWEMTECLDHNIIFRIHVGGDFATNDTVDTVYLQSWVEVFTAVMDKKGKLPKIWLYTHMRSPEIADAFAPFADYVKVYASVNTDEELFSAKEAGFTLFAYATATTQKSVKKCKPPVKIELSGETFLVCPEQRQKYSELSVTCSTCQYCTKGLGNVAFLSH